MKPILEELHHQTEGIEQDKSLSRDERLAKVRPYRYKANAQIRAILREDQQKALDLYLRGPHQEVHGNLVAQHHRYNRPRDKEPC
jgi:hypothetical protein